MYFLKRSLFSVLICIGILLSVSPAYALEPQLAELNPAYLTYLETQETLDYIPPSFAPVSGIYALSTLADDLPDAYDARTVGKVPFIKDQGVEGVCWAFAGNSSLEAFLASQGPYSFSENHPRFATSNTGGNTLGFGREAGGGGNFNNVYASYVLNWLGPVFTSDDPYNTTVALRPIAETLAMKPRFHVQGYVALPNPERSIRDVTSEQRVAHVQQAKKLVYEYGSVFTSMYYNQAFISNQSAYYYKDSPSLIRGGNHAVSIVGWDDHYSKDNFNEPRPSSDGAFLIKNSWGSDWFGGLQGYFWMSYEDVYAAWDAAAINQVDPLGRLENIYQYDNYGITASLGFGEGDNWFANVFTRKNDNESLAAVSFGVINSGTPYEIWINTENDSFDDFNSSFRKVQSGTMELSGYQTVYLEEEVPINGEKFIVAVKVVSDAGDEYSIPLEMPIPAYSANSLSAPATSNAGESFYARDPQNYSWNDLTNLGATQNANVCLKAFTVKTHSAACDIVSITVPDHPVIDGHQISATVDYFVETLTPEITVSEKATWKLYQDELCTNEITSLPLQYGENVAYIQVRAENGHKEIYTLNITRPELTMFLVNAPTLWNGEDEVLSLPSTGGTFTVKTKFISTDDFPLNAKCYAAVYKNDVCQSVHSSEQWFGHSGEDHILENQIVVPSTEAGDTVKIKILLLDQNAFLTPLSFLTIWE